MLAAHEEDRRGAGPGRSAAIRTRRRGRPWPVVPRVAVVIRSLPRSTAARKRCSSSSPVQRAPPLSSNPVRGGPGGGGAAWAGAPVAARAAAQAVRARARSRPGVGGGSPGGSRRGGPPGAGAVRPLRAAGPPPCRAAERQHRAGFAPLAAPSRTAGPAPGRTAGLRRTGLRVRRLGRGRRRPVGRCGGGGAGARQGGQGVGEGAADDGKPGGGAGQVEGERRRGGGRRDEVPVGAADDEGEAVSCRDDVVGGVQVDGERVRPAGGQRRPRCGSAQVPRSAQPRLMTV